MEDIILEHGYPHFFYKLLTLLACMEYGFCLVSSLTDLLGLNMKRQKSGRSHV